jgi:hypothetical protein
MLVIFFIMSSCKYKNPSAFTKRDPKRRGGNPEMITSTKQFTVYGNLALVQFHVEPETIFNFKPAGPEMESGGLVISEATGLQCSWIQNWSSLTFSVQ